MQNTLEFLNSHSAVNKIAYVRIASAILLVLMLFFSVFNVSYTHQYKLAAVEFVSFLASLYVLVSIKSFHKKAIVAFSVTMFALMMFVTYFIPSIYYGLIWGLLIPINAFFILKEKDALLQSALFFIYLVFLLFYLRYEDISGRIAINLLLMYAVVTIISYINARNNAGLHQNEQNLIEMFEKLSTIDKLTQLYNRSKIDSILEYEIDYAKRYATPLSIALVDIDFFKKVNDTYGHQAGDVILQEFSKLLKQNLRTTDFVARWGGEEFLVVFPHTSLDAALELTNKLCQLVENNDFSYVFSNTCSIGVSSFNDDDTKTTLIERADKALYYAKEHGRNRVISQKSVV